MPRQGPSRQKQQEGGNGTALRPSALQQHFSAGRPDPAAAPVAAHPDWAEKNPAAGPRPFGPRMVFAPNQGVKTAALL